MFYGAKQCFSLRLCQMAPLTDFQIAQMNMHNADALQTRHFIAQFLAHPADLTVHSFCENDAKLMPPGLFHRAGLRHRPQYRHALTHFSHKISPNGLFDTYDVLFFVLIARAQNFIYDIPVIGEQKESGRWFIQPSYGKNALGSSLQNPRHFPLLFFPLYR